MQALSSPGLARVERDDAKKRVQPTTSTVRGQTFKLRAGPLEPLEWALQDSHDSRLARASRLRTLVLPRPSIILFAMNQTTSSALLGVALFLSAVSPVAAFSAPPKLALSACCQDAGKPEAEPKKVVQILQTETREIAKNLYTIRWPKGKTVTFFVGEDAVLLIDTHVKQEIYNIEGAIAKVTDKPVTHLINTHWHGDHTGSNEHWGKTATIIAHENAKLRMEASDKIEGRVAKVPMTGDALPDVTFKDKMELDFGGQKIQLIHMYGGHTDGDIIVWFPELKTCVTGDVFYSSSYPFVDTRAGGHPFQLLDIAEQLQEMMPEGTTLIPGHGVPVDVEVLTEYRDMLEGTMFKVQEGLDKGLNVTGIIKEGLLDEYAERWDEKGTGTRAWVFALFQALKP